MDRRVIPQARARQLEKRGGGTESASFQMDKRARELNESFVKRPVGPLAIGQPKLFQDIVRFVKQTQVKALEVTEVVRVELFSAARFDQGGDLRAFFAHRNEPKG